MTEYVYHYYGVQTVKQGNPVHIDGVVISNLPIRTYEDYNRLKQGLVDSSSLLDSVDDLAIHSLSLIHKQESKK